MLLNSLIFIILTGAYLNDFNITTYEIDPVAFPTAAATLCYSYVGMAGISEIINRTCTNGPIIGRYVRLTNGPRICPLMIFEVSVF